MSTTSSVAYIKEGNFLCRMYYEKEQINFEVYKMSRKPIEERDYKTMDIDSDVQREKVERFRTWRKL